MTKKIIAFTLAEVLITLTIIGVVAALTIPTIVSKIQKRQVETQLKETYNNLHQIIRIAEENGALIQESLNPSAMMFFEDFIEPYMKTAKVCYNEAGCWHEPGIVKDLKKNTPSGGYSFMNENGIDNRNGVGFITLKGEYFKLLSRSISELSSWYGIPFTTSRNGGIAIVFDVNGKSKPNVVGKDIFAAGYAYGYGFLPAGFGYLNNKRNLNSYCINQSGNTCLAKVISDNYTIVPELWNK